MTRAFAVLALALFAAACSKGEDKSVSALPPDPSQALPAAFHTAFGGDAPVEREVTRQGKAVTLPFSPALITDLGDGRVALVSEGEASPGCTACNWSVTVTYLTAADNHFTVAGQWTDLVPTSPGDDAPHMRIRKDLFDRPALESEVSRRDTGCESSSATLWELTPQGPVLRAKGVNTRRNNIPMGALRTGPMVDYDANIIPDAKGKRMIARYHGTQGGDVTYAPGPGGVWTAQPGGFKPPEC